METFQEFKKRGHQGKEKKVSSSSLMYKVQRNISIHLSWFLVKFFPKVKPNHVSVFNILLLLFVVLLSGSINSSNFFYIVLIQMLLINFSAILDKIDGELARCKNILTQKGIYYDLTYHFVYPSVFYFVVGYFFYGISGEVFIFFLSLIVGILAVVNNMFGKIRHHIRYKILRVGLKDKIQDYIGERISEKRPEVVMRIFNYFVFFIYDWVWSLYFVLILFSVFAREFIVAVYTTHLIVSLIMFLKYVLIENPQKRLYTKEEMD